MSRSAADQSQGVWEAMGERSAVQEVCGHSNQGHCHQHIGRKGSLSFHVYWPNLKEGPEGAHQRGQVSTTTKSKSQSAWVEGLHAPSGGHLDTLLPGSAGTAPLTCSTHGRAFQHGTFRNLAPFARLSPSRTNQHAALSHRPGRATKADRL